MHSNHLEGNRKPYRQETTIRRVKTRLIYCIRKVEEKRRGKDEVLKKIKNEDLN